MASCKDCIHDKVCSEYSHAFWGHTANKHSDLINADPKDCPYFKDRSRFVELSFVTLDGRVVPHKEAEKALKERENNAGQNDT